MRKNDIRTLDLNLLKALDALLDERHVTRAAARLGVTQPAMSGILTRLRENFGDPLFSRSQRGIVPTQRALALAQPVRQVLADIDALMQPPVFDPASATLDFSIAATDYALRAIAVPLLAALKQRAPHLRIALTAVEDGPLQERLERGQIDLALTTPETTPPGLHARRLFDERYVCVVREDHPLVRGKRIGLKQFCALDHALVSYSGDPFVGVTDEMLARQGLARRVTLSVQRFLVLPDILRASDMVAVVPRRLVAGMPGLKLLEPPLDIPGFTKTAAWHERTHRDPAHRWLRELLFETCRTPG
ncbi:LysR family transcriptional regulator [Herbaspirillum sp. LeCh32-8]|uniref:LysR family transcriptional regulator n=1 Tax=Herbaspirillum sp. LeCh32-8 TaxID=2821356 RepID=UPI001AE99B5A|nr:LysR family transcriptional regulator [Herbaspirillum sp. LeCh32-8]MBP0598619.1 LysR family transcriptional regulator [Herbaspirillum sp. LeCh32-8]